MKACVQCGMVTKSATEYHPYAACLMFLGCHDGDTVRANLAALAETQRSSHTAGSDEKNEVGAALLSREVK